MFCMYCGAELPDGAVFCSKCGKRLRSMDDNLTLEESREHVVTRTTETDNIADSAQSRQEEFTQPGSGGGLFNSIHQGFARMKKSIEDNNEASESLKAVFMAYNISDDHNSDAQNQSEQAFSHAVDIGMMDQLYISKMPIFKNADDDPELFSMKNKILEKAQAPAGITYDQMRGGLKKAMKSFAADTSIRDLYAVYKFESNDCPSFMEDFMEKRELIVNKTEQNYATGLYQTRKVKKYHQDLSGNWIIDKSWLSGLFS